MFDAKHTPPPWEVRDLAVWSSEGFKVLDSPSGDLNQIEKDLQLAAAAPELLAALERIDSNGVVPKHWRSYAMMKAAIAKAKGETYVDQ